MPYVPIWHPKLKRSAERTLSSSLSEAAKQIKVALCALCPYVVIPSKCSAESTLSSSLSEAAKQIKVALCALCPYVVIPSKRPAESTPGLVYGSLNKNTFYVSYVPMW